MVFSSLISARLNGCELIHTSMREQHLSVWILLYLFSKLRSIGLMSQVSGCVHPVTIPASNLSLSYILLRLISRHGSLNLHLSSWLECILVYLLWPGQDSQNSGHVTVPQLYHYWLFFHFIELVVKFEKITMAC